MYVVMLRLADATRVSEHLDDHRRWLQRGFDDNVFFLTGGIPQAGGGAVIAAGLSLEELRRRLDEDPFVVRARGRPGDREAAGRAGHQRLSYSEAYQAWCRACGSECLRVLKTGGQLLAFGSPRTAHRLAAGLEDAGLELRDTLLWLYGTGMPKSRRPRESESA